MSLIRIVIMFVCVTVLGTLLTVSTYHRRVLCYYWDILLCYKVLFNTKDIIVNIYAGPTRRWEIERKKQAGAELCQDQSSVDGKLLKKISELSD